MLPGLPGYAELHCRSNFSFLTGASHPEELVARAHALGYSALALTDECSLSGVVRAHAEAKRVGLHLIIGAEMQLANPAARGPVKTSGAGVAGAADAPPRLLLLAQSRRGYGNLSQWITVARRRAAKGSYIAQAADLEGRVPHAPYLAGLPGCIALVLPGDLQSFQTVFAHAMWLKTWFGPERAYIAVQLLHGAHDATRLDVLRRVAHNTGLGLVASGGVLMHARSRKPLQDMLSATRLNTPVAACGLALQPNAEAYLRSRGRLAALYRPEWLDATVRIAGSCAFSLDELRYEYPEEIVPAGHTPTSWLRSLAEAGVARRFPAGMPSLHRATLEEELALIAQLKYEPYFLTVADVVHWAREQKILCQGRGSAANSLVCYCLGVTEVDPQRATLLFGRFISAERNEPPDIDIDFEHQRREEVIQYIYKKYGRHRAALTGVVISYRPRSALRDVGRALGIDSDRIDAVAKSTHWFDGRHVSAQRLRENGFDPESSVCKLWVELTQTLIGFPRHLSQHPGGFVIARDDLARLVPVENAAMKDRSVIQWDKDDLDALGLIKVDILALGMLSALRRSLQFVGDKRQQAFGMSNIPDGDTPTFDMICAADTVGVFQIESRAQMSMLPRLQPRTYYDLVVEVAIVRPGPIQGGMVHPYLRNRTLHDDQIDCPDEIKPALLRTKGVPIFQEQVMQIAMLAADFTAGEADSLRRAMAAWKRKGGLGPFHERLVGRMVEKGYERDYAERIFKQIEGFGEYGFPESHAASFALLVYASAWLKCHHPDAFLAALLNSQPMGFYAPAQLVRDARAHGVEVLPVDVNLSQWDSTLVAAARQTPGRPKLACSPSGGPSAADPSPPARTWTAQGPGASGAGRTPQSGSLGGDARLWPVRLGLNRIGGFAEDAARRLLAARADAPFASVEDLGRRAALDAGQLALLAHADALRPIPLGPQDAARRPPEGEQPDLGSGPAAGLVGHRHQAAWAVAGVDTRATPLLKATRTDEGLAELDAPGPAETMLADYRATGLSLTQHPLALLRDTLATFKVQPAAVLRGYRNGQLARASGLVTHRQRPETAKGVVFVTLEDESGAVNIIVWPDVAEAQRKPLLASTLLTVYGVWQCEGDGPNRVMHLIARKLVDHSHLLNGLVSRSRNFR